MPDVQPAALKGAWEATQQLLQQRKISAGHDISDGGLVTALLEMAFAGNCGVQARPWAAIKQDVDLRAHCQHGLAKASSVQQVDPGLTQLPCGDCLTSGYYRAVCSWLRGEGTDNLKTSAHQILVAVSRTLLCWPADGSCTDTSLAVQVDLPQCSQGPTAALFAEELGLLLEVDSSHAQAVQDAYR